MTLIKRIFFFLLTNIAVLVLITVVMQVINIFYPGILNANGGIINLLVYAIVIGFTGSFISLWISRWSAKKSYGIVLLDEKTSRDDEKLAIVYDTVVRIAQANNITLPEVGYYESSEPNAFATGATKNSSLVAVSTGLLSQMDKGEIEGVVGHEMAHILNGDMVTLTLLQGVMNTFVIFISSIVAKIIASFFQNENDETPVESTFTYTLITIGLQMLFGFLAMFVVMWFSRIREYRADLGGAQYTSKSKMIPGLKKLKKMSHQETQTGDVDKKMAAFMINEKDSFFSTHPSLDNRIKSLEENYQLH